MKKVPCIVVVGLLALGMLSCDTGTGSSAGSNTAGQDTPPTVQLIEESHETTAVTGEGGTVTLDSSSFDKEVVLEVTDLSGQGVGGLSVDYVQEGGIFALRVSDPNGYFSDIYQITDAVGLAEGEDSQSVVAYSNGAEIEANVVISGPLLVVGLVLQGISAYHFGDEVIETVSFHIENVQEQTLTRTVYDTTVGESGEYLKSVFGMAAFPITTALNIATLGHGGTLAGHGLQIAGELAAENIILALINYLIDVTARAVNEATEIRITIHHFRFVTEMNPAFAQVASFFGFDDQGAVVEIEVIDANEDQYDGSYVITSESVSISSDYADLTVSVFPSDSSVSVELDLVGTDGYTQSSQEYTNSLGEASFLVPVGEEGVRDIATLSLPASGFVKDFAWEY